MKKTIVLLFMLAPLAAPAIGQQLGSALWAQGYTHTLYLDASPSHAKTIGPFNPNAVTPQDRYGPAVQSGVSFGNTVGERASCETVDRYVAAGLLPGLGAGYHCTSFDLSDTRLLTRSGTQAAYDDMVAALPKPPGDGDGGSNTPCVLPKVCMVPPGTCQPCQPCPICPTPVVCPQLAAIPADIVPLLKQISGYLVIGPGRRNQILRVLQWAQTVEAVKTKP
ncbi:MAG: hypothetical protein DMF53_21885 [Acidobacteria bacterium]|nr:MAG: hypothetical protein DMF53_21885 [Acidobacteriota bacterium]